MNLMASTPLSALADADLMQRVRDSDLAAFETLAQRWRRPLERFFFPLTWSEDDAQDCVQETLMRLWRARDRYEPCGKFSTYLFQIAKRYWMNERARKRVDATPLETVPALPGLTFRDYNHPVGHLLSRHRDARVQQAISRLSEGPRLALVLCHFEGMTQREAADVLEIPVGTVKSRVAAAFTELRRSLADLVEGD
jgi:RNA polymerase sigma-70 factor (ECF subfamily)